MLSDPQNASMSRSLARKLRLVAVADHVLSLEGVLEFRLLFSQNCMHFTSTCKMHLMTLSRAEREGVPFAVGLVALSDLDLLKQLLRFAKKRH